MRQFCFILFFVAQAFSLQYFDVRGYLKVSPWENVEDILFSDLEQLIYKEVENRLPNVYFEVTYIREYEPTGTINFAADVTSHGEFSKEDILDTFNESKTVKLALITIGHQTSLKTRQPRRRERVQLNSNLCENDGIPLPDGRSCQCKPYTSGQYCETVRCENWGIKDGNRCKCPPGKYAEHCENRGCRPLVEENTTPDKRSVIVALSSIPSMYNVRQILIDNLKTTFANLEANEPGYIGSYLVVLSLTNVNATGVHGLAGFDTADEMVNWIGNVTISSGPYSDTQDMMYALESIQEYTSMMYPNAIVLVFTNAPNSGEPPIFSTSRLSHEMKVTQQALAWKNRIYFFVTQTTNAPVNTSSFGYDVFRRVSMNTHGELFLLDESELTNVVQNYIPRLYKPELMIAQSFIPCNIYRPQLIFREFPHQTINVLITVDSRNGVPNDFNLTFLGEGYPVAPELSGKYWKLYTLPLDRIQWTVMSSTSTGSDLICSIRTFVSSSFTVLTSYSDNNFVDVGTGVRPAQTNSYLTAHFTNSPFAVSEALLKVLNSTDVSDTFAPWYHPTERHQCTYEAIYGQLPHCEQGSFTVQFTFTSNSAKKIRVYPVYCTQAEKLYQPPRPVTPSPTNNINISYCYQMNDKVLTDPQLLDYRQIIFVVETTAQMFTSNQQLASIISDFVNKTGDGAIRQYTLVVFGQDASQTHVALSTYDSDVFFTQFPIALNSHSQNNTNASTGFTFDAVYKAIGSQILDSAIINVFTSTSPQGWNDQFIWPMNVQVNFFVVSDTVPVNSQFSIAQRLTRGRILSLHANSVSKLTPMLVSAIYENNLVSDENSNDCSSGSYFSFPVENSAKSSILTLTGQDINKNAVTVQLNQNSNPITVSGSMLLFNDSNVLIVSLPNLYGQLNVSLQAKGACSLQARVVSDVNTAIGFVFDPHNDFAAKLPFSRRTQSRLLHTVVRTSPATMTDATVLFQTADLTKNSISNTSYSSAYLNSKDAATCAYPYRSDIALMPDSDYVRMILVGKDVKGSYFQRVFFYHTPRLTADSTICHYGKLDANGNCACQASYTGEFCDNPICQNGGTSNYGVCACQDGYAGVFCEISFYYTTTSTSTTTSTTMQPTTKASSTNWSLLKFVFVLFCLLCN